MPELTNPSGKPIYKAWRAANVEEDLACTATETVQETAGNNVRSDIAALEAGMNDKISGLKWILGLIAAGVVGQFIRDFFAG